MRRMLTHVKDAPYWRQDVEYQSGDWLLFGSETKGLPPLALSACCQGVYAGGTARIPINETYVRSLNLSVAVGVGLYEAVRQLDGRKEGGGL